MREIKFRGKRVDNGEFCYGSPVKNIIHTGNCISHDKKNIFHEKYEVIPETIGQYTGFKDKDNKPLYEGDIVRDDENLCVVVFIEKWGMFSLILKQEYESYKLLGTESLDETMFWTFIVEDKVYKLVGNIYENEHLLHDK